MELRRALGDDLKQPLGKTRSFHGLTGWIKKPSGKDTRVARFGRIPESLRAQSAANSPRSASNAIPTSAEGKGLACNATRLGLDCLHGFLDRNLSSFVGTSLFSPLAIRMRPYIVGRPFVTLGVALFSPLNGTSRLILPLRLGADFLLSFFLHLRSMVRSILPNYFLKEGD